MQLHQLDHMQMICTLLHTDNHTNTSSLNFYRLDALPDAQPTVSEHWRHLYLPLLLAVFHQMVAVFSISWLSGRIKYENLLSVWMMVQDFHSTLYGTTLASQKADVECEARISQALCLTVSVDELLRTVQQTSFVVSARILSVIWYCSRLMDIEEIVADM